MLLLSVLLLLYCTGRMDVAAAGAAASWTLYPLPQSEHYLGIALKADLEIHLVPHP